MRFQFESRLKNGAFPTNRQIFPAWTFVPVAQIESRHLRFTLHPSLVTEGRQCQTHSSWCYSHQIYVIFGRKCSYLGWLKRNDDDSTSDFEIQSKPKARNRARQFLLDNHSQGIRCACMNFWFGISRAIARTRYRPGRFADHFIGVNGVFVSIWLFTVPKWAAHGRQLPEMNDHHDPYLHKILSAKL